jgi:hypothetical protein
MLSTASAAYGRITLRVRRSPPPAAGSVGFGFSWISANPAGFLRISLEFCFQYLWGSLDFLVRIGAFQRVTSTEAKKNSRPSLPAKPGCPSDPWMTFAVTLEAHADRLSKILLFSNELAPICRKTRI